MSAILMVEDSPTQSQMIANMLTGAGFEVTVAEDGVAALEEMLLRQPELVLTDMDMPRMNGLELVEAIREQYPLVPSVLMTAQGSEEIAFQALERGAASYVPKENLGQLAATLRRVLATAGAGRKHRRLAQCIDHFEMSLTLDNDCTLVPPLVDQLRETIGEVLGLDETGSLRVGIALEEALLDALYSGNLEVRPDLAVTDPDGYQREVEQRLEATPYRTRRIHVRASATHDEATVAIRHDGPGTDHASVNLAQMDDLACRSQLLMRTFMNEVSYNAAGTETTLVKRREK